jgi:hypothetical protein
VFISSEISKCHNFFLIYSFRILESAIPEDRCVLRVEDNLLIDSSISEHTVMQRRDGKAASILIID